MKQFGIFYTTLSLVLLLGCSIPSRLLAQPKSIAYNKYDQLYLSEQMSTSDFLDSTYAHILRQLHNGAALDSEQLITLLSLYKKTAWSSKPFDVHKRNYYKLLIQNAQNQNKGGEALFYIDIIETEERKQGKKRSLAGLNEKYEYFASIEDHHKIISLYAQDAPLLANVPFTLRDSATSQKYYYHALIIYTTLVYALSNTGDRMNQIPLILKKEKAIRDTVAAIYGKESKQYIMSAWVYGLSGYYNAFIKLKDYKLAEQILQDMARIIDADHQPEQSWKNKFRLLLYHNKTDLFTKMSKNDSATHYLNKYKAAFPDQYVLPRIGHMEATLYAQSGQYEQAFHALEKAYKIQDTQINSIQQEAGKILYAYTEARYNKEKLEEARAATQKRSGIIIIVSLVAAFLYWYMRRRQSKLNNTIKELNNMANLQVASLEEIKLQERILEQKQLGLELHDSYGSVIAGLKFQLEELIEQTKDIPLKQKATGIEEIVNNLYETIRNKSHKLASAFELTDAESFEERVKKLAYQSLPVNRYTTLIIVDDNCLQKVTVEMKIGILRIIQEAITNILKHAKANIVEITLFEEDEMLQLNITDNGSGLKKKSKNGLGLQSISRILAEHNGTMNLQSEAGITSLTARFPLPTDSYHE
ncbi:MAG: hypothetical protein JNM21_09685 [Taibaiella sp.]|nr:hypothetical protein [Taibaiella sp.]